MKYIILILLSNLCFSQSDYLALRKEAWKHYQQKNFLKSGETYLKALALVKDLEVDESILNIKFNASCAFALAGDKKRSFNQLMDMGKNDHYANLKQLKSDTDLSSLHSDPRWEQVTKLVSRNYEKVKPVSKEELKKIYREYKKAQDNVFRSGSSLSDVKRLYSFYTDDFIYNHPGYGGKYSREHLYKNTVKFMEAGRYKNSRKRKTINIIYGLNALCIEQQYEGEDRKTMTLFKLRKNKIYYIEEYW